MAVVALAGWEGPRLQDRVEIVYAPTAGIASGMSRANHVTGRNVRSVARRWFVNRLCERQ